MKTLGISAFYHDSAAALVEDGRVIAAAQEERFSRIKHDAAFPTQAVRYCLSLAGGAVDAVVYYEKPIQKFERILTTAFAVAPRGFKAFTTALPLWLRKKLWIPAIIENELAALGCDVRDRVAFASHHESHAASAFFASPFSRAAYLTLDGVGEWASSAFGRGEGNRLTALGELRFPHSLGLLYSAFTYYCGFRVNSGEYKLMGLAPYGVPRYEDLILERLLDLKPDGSFRLDLKYFGFLEGETMTNGRFDDVFGGPARDPSEDVTQRHCDLARSIQAVTEKIVLRMAATVHERTGEENLCLAGGVALNCVANGRLLREGPFKRLWIQPAAGDAGGALGAALAYFYQHTNASRDAMGTASDAMQNSYLGPSYTDAEIEAVLTERGLKAERLEGRALLERVAERVAAGAVVGFFQGRAEFGPRALGNRSILADARSPEMQSILNLKIKFRESFRPFAPIVLAERASEYFELDTPSPYMLLTAPVRHERRRPVAAGAEGLREQLRAERSDIPAVTHVDYSARVQTVDETDAPLLHGLLAAFDRLTGCPVMINTSFNVRGEPPVCHPNDAIDGFISTGMDCLAIGSFFLEKRDLDPHRLQTAGRRKFAAD